MLMIGWRQTAGVTHKATSLALAGHQATRINMRRGSTPAGHVVTRRLGCPGFLRDCDVEL